MFHHSEPLSPRYSFYIIGHYVYTVLILTCLVCAGENEHCPNSRTHSAAQGTFQGEEQPGHTRGNWTPSPVVTVSLKSTSDSSD